MTGASAPALSSPSRLTLRARVALLCVVVGGLLAVLAGGAAVVANANRDHIDTILNTTGPLRADAESLLTTLVDQETGVRGYAVTGDPADLAPYQEGLFASSNCSTTWPGCSTRVIRCSPRSTR